MRPRLTTDAEIRAAHDFLVEAGEKITIDTLRARIGNEVATARLTEFLRKARAEARKQQESIPSGVAKLFNDAAFEVVRVAREQLAAEFDAEKTELVEGQKLLETENLALWQRVEESAAELEALRAKLHQTRAELLAARSEMAKVVPALQDHAIVIERHAKEKNEWSERTRQLEIDLAVTKEKLSAADTRRRN